MADVTVNGKKITVEDGITVLQACELAGVEIPRFCYHERLSIAGNCRMCLVQIEGGPPKPAASCAMPVANNMVVHTDTPMVKKAREGVMEFLLINHPLDCPICDQGGECDLQDQAMTYGRGRNRYDEEKRAVKDKYLGPLIKTHMNRCIHCTRCVRFGEEIAGVDELGATGRGEDMEIGTFVGEVVSSELSGNMIDLCPVGALTSRPYAFKSRNWELRKTESIDVLDAVGSNIRVDARGREVMRILPRLNEEINEEWISDKTRFAYDGLKTQRLDKPYVRKGGKLQPASWEEAYAAIAAALKGVKGDQIAAIVGDLADCEAIMVLKDVMEGLESPHTDCRQEGAMLDAGNRSSYLFNSTIAGIEQADAVLILGCNPRYEAALVNARIRKRYQQLRGKLPVAVIGPEVDLTYKSNNLGNNIEIIEEILSGKHAFAQNLSNAKKPLIILGYGALMRKDGAAIAAQVAALANKFNVIQEGWNGFNVLHRAASRVGALDLGFVPAKKGKDVAGIRKLAEQGEIKFLYLLGADELDLQPFKDTFIVYQGHHGDRGAHGANVVLPGAAYTEKNATYVNLEGRVQRTQLAVFPPGEAKEDWKILAELAERLNIKLPYSSLAQVRERMVQIAPHMAQVDAVMPAPWQGAGKEGKITGKALLDAPDNFYMTDPITRASTTMAKCSQELLPVAKAKQEEAA